MKLSKTLAPLEPLKHKINVIHGLFNKARHRPGHSPRADRQPALRRDRYQKGAIIKAGITVDQMIANSIGQDTAQPSIVLACEQPMTGYHETNFSMAYSSHISWQSPDSPVPNEVYPSLAWDNLFENRGSLRNMSILDRVKDSAEALSRKISSTDKAKLDEYLTSVREVEKRVDGMRKNKDKAEDLAKQKNRPVVHDGPPRERPARRLPRTHAADVRHHRHRVPDGQDPRGHAAALARSFGAVLSVPRSPRRPPCRSHNNNSDGYERIARFHLSQLAYLATKLDSMPEGDGTVLDNSCLMFLSNMWIGRKHDNTRLPLVLAGGLGGTLKTGRTLDYLTSRRRESEDVQPVPLAHGSDGRQARPLRRRRLSLSPYIT